MRRRRILQTLGMGGITSLAGCTALDGNGSGNGETSSENEEPDPGYSEVSDFESSINAEDTDSYTFTAGVERSLEGETTVLDAKITDAYIIRDNEDYSDEILEEAGLYQEIRDELEQEDNEYTLPTDQLLPGNNILHLEIEVEDNEHEYNETLTFEETISVDTDTQQILDQTWIEDRDIFTQLRKEYREEALSTTAESNGVGEEDTTWMDVSEQAREQIDEEYDIDYEEEPIDMRLNTLAASWIDIASDIINGGPSGQADYLGYTLEEHEDVETTDLINEGHNTVLAYHRDEDKTYHVETGAAGRTEFPPESATWPSDNKDKSSMWPSEGGQIGGAKSTLASFGEVESDDLHQRVEIADETAETGMAQLRDGTDQETMIDTMQNAGVSAALSPEIDYEISGDINNLEVSAELS